MSISPFHRSIFSRLPSRSIFLPAILHNAIPSHNLPAAAAAATGIQQARGYAKKRGAPKKDPKLKMIDYTLAHTLTNRPLKFSYMRNLRHWTIMQAWQRFKHNQKKERELELERQYNKIHEACEELKKVDERLFRVATDRKGVGYFPAEMRIPTDTPPRGGFNEEWKRPKEKVVKKR